MRLLVIFCASLTICCNTLDQLDKESDRLLEELNKPSQPASQRKDGCKFVREVYHGGVCKTCLYECPGYGAPVTFPQAKDKPCPPIGSHGLVDTRLIDPRCRY